jgi:hypothetical protein
MKLKKVLFAFAITSSLGVVSFAQAEDGLAKVIRQEVRTHKLKVQLSALRQAASNFDKNPTQEALTGFKNRLQKTIDYLNKTGVTLNALGEALEDATGRQEATAKSFALTASSPTLAQPSASPTAEPSMPRRPGAPKNPML